MSATPVTPTTDLERASLDLKTHGYAILCDVIPADLLVRARSRIEAQAKAEREAGIAVVQNGNTQWVSNVLNKGEPFLDLLTCNEASHALTREVLGDNYILSCANAPIAGPGTARMSMHADQYWSPQIERDPAARPLLGDTSFETMPATTDPVARDFLFPACMVTLIWALTDFTRENGATVFVPGSHLSGRQPLHDGAFDDAAIAEMPAGSMVLWDGRTWHATGKNTTKNEYRIGVTNNLVAPMIRPLVNYPYSLRAEVVARLTDRQRALLGFTTWSAYGNEGVPGQELGAFRPASEQPGPMTPA